LFSVLKSATIQVNVRARDKITEEVLLGVLRGELNPSPWNHYENQLFSGIPAPFLRLLIEEEGLEMETLLKICDALPAPMKASCKKQLQCLY